MKDENRRLQDSYNLLETQLKMEKSENYALRNEQRNIETRSVMSRATSGRNAFTRGFDSGSVQNGSLRNLNLDQSGIVNKSKLESEFKSSMRSGPNVIIDDESSIAS